MTRLYLKSPPTPEIILYVIELLNIEQIEDVLQCFHVFSFELISFGAVEVWFTVAVSLL